MSLMAQKNIPAMARLRWWLRPLTGLLLLLLALEFTIGMVVNLWVSVPSSHPGTNAGNYFGGIVQGIAWALATSDRVLQLHVLVGILLLLGSILLLVAAIQRRDPLWLWVASIGFIGITAAGFNGASFLNYGHDFSSMLMSGGFVLALCSYMAGLYFTRPDTR